MVVEASVDAAQRVLARRAVEYVGQLVQVVGVGVYALQRLHAWCGEGAALDRGASAQARGRACAWEGLVRVLFFDGGGDLGDGVGDYVKGVLRELVRECRFQRVSARQAYHVDEDDGELDGDEFAWRGQWLGLEGGKWDLRMGATNNDIEEVSDLEVFACQDVRSRVCNIEGQRLNLPHLTVACPRGSSRSQARR